MKSGTHSVLKDICQLLIALLGDEVRDITLGYEEVVLSENSGSAFFVIALRYSLRDGRHVVYGETREALPNVLDDPDVERIRRTIAQRLRLELEHRQMILLVHGHLP